MLKPTIHSDIAAIFVFVCVKEVRAHSQISILGSWNFSCAIISVVVRVDFAFAITVQHSTGDPDPVPTLPGLSHH